MGDRSNIFVYDSGGFGLRKRDKRYIQAGKKMFVLILVFVLSLFRSGVVYFTGRGLLLLISFLHVCSSFIASLEVRFPGSQQLSSFPFDVVLDYLTDAGMAYNPQFLR